MTRYVSALWCVSLSIHIGTEACIHCARGKLTLFTVPPLRTSRRRILFAEEDSARATSTATTKSSDAAPRYMDTTPSAIAIPDAQAPPAAAGTSTDGAHNTLAPHHEPAPVADMAEPAEATSTMSSMSSAPIEIAMLDAATAVREPAVFVAPQVQHDELEAFHQRLLESATKLPLAWLLRLHTEVYGVVFLWLSDVRRELVLHEVRASAAHECSALLTHIWNRSLRGYCNMSCPRSRALLRRKRRRCTSRVLALSLSLAWLAPLVEIEPNRFEFI